VHAASDRVKTHLRIKKTKSEWLGLDLWPIAMGLGCRHDTKQLNSAGKMFSCCLYSCHLSPASAPPTESPPMPPFLGITFRRQLTLLLKAQAFLAYHVFRSNPFSVKKLGHLDGSY